MRASVGGEYYYSIAYSGLYDERKYKFLLFIVFHIIESSSLPTRKCCGGPKNKRMEAQRVGADVGERARVCVAPSQN